MSKYERMVVSSQSQCSMGEVFEKDANRHPYRSWSDVCRGILCIRGTGKTSVWSSSTALPASASDSGSKAKAVSDL